MATTFTGLRVQNTYNAILKIGDNTNLTGTAKLLSDGFGNSSAIYLSTTSIGIGVTPSYQLHTSGNAKIGGNLIISGNLTVNGTLTYLNVIDLEVKDPLIKLATDNTANSLDIGFFGKYVSTGTRYKGLFNDASDDKFKLFLGTTIEPGTTVNTSGNGYTIGTLVANLEGNVTGGTISGTTGSFTGLVTGIAPTSALNFATKKYVDDSIPVVPGTPTLSAVLAVGNTSGANNLKMADTKKILLGDDDDVEFFSNSAGYLINNTGNLYIENLANDRDISFICSDGNNGSSVYLFMDGSVQRNKFFQNTQVNDNITLGIGSDLDLNFKHDGSDSYIRNTKGNLNIYSDVDDGDITFNLDNGASPAVATVYMRLDGGDENIVFAKPISGTTGAFSGLVTGIAPTADLNFATKKYVDDNIPTITTPALSAVLAVGNTSGSNNLIIEDDNELRIGSNSDFKLYHNQTNTLVRVNTGDLIFNSFVADGDIKFNLDNGADPSAPTEYMRFDGGILKTIFSKTVVISNNLSPTLQLLDTNNNVNLQLIATDINVSIGTYSAHPLIFVQNTGTVLTIDTSKNSTFVGNVGIGVSPITSPNGADKSLSIFSGQDCGIILKDNVETWEIYQNDDLQFSFGTTPTTVLTLARTTGNATFASSVTATSFIGPLTGNVTGAASLNVLKAGDTMTGPLQINSVNGSPGGNLKIYSTTQHQYGQIYSDSAKEAMWNYKNDTAEWYVGLRQSTQFLGATSAFAFYNTSSTQTIGGYTVGGDHYAKLSSNATIFKSITNTSFYYDPTGGSQQQYTFNVSGTSGNYGSQVIAGQSSIAYPYTLQDTNVRPILAATGKYPVLNLNHTVTTNPNHGPTIQFTFDGLSNRQWVFGAAGDGTDLQIGYSDLTNNTEFNPHNGISGYSGTTYMMFQNDGKIGIGSGGDWGVYGTSMPGYALDTRGTLFNNTDVRAPIFYDSTDTNYYLDPASTGISLNVSGRIQTSSTGLNAAPSLEINNPSASTFMHSAEVFTANMTTGQTNIFVLGKVGSTKNAGYLGFNYSGTLGSNNNYASIGLWGADNLFRVYGDQILGTVTQRNNVDFRAPIFYDSDNTNYYLDPASTSILGFASFEGINTAYNTRTGTGVGIGRYTTAYSYIDLASTNSTFGSWIDFSKGDGTDYAGRIRYHNSLEKFIFTTAANNNEFEIYGSFTLSLGSSRAPIFYDSDNTGYYLNPASTSNLNAVAINGSLTVAGDSIFSGNVYGKSVNAAYSLLYRFGGLFFTWDSDTYGTNFEHSLTSTSNGVYGDNITLNSYGKVRINFDSNNNDSADFSIGTHTTGTANQLLHLDSAGNNTVTGSSRAPIFYDSDNTGFYINPNAASKINNISIDGSGNYPLQTSSTQRYNIQIRNINNTTNANYGWWWFMDTNFNMGFHADGSADKLTITRAGDVTAVASSRAPIFYDSDNTGYFMNPAASSVIYNLSLTGAKHTYLELNPGSSHESMVRYMGSSGGNWFVGKRTATQSGMSPSDFHWYNATTGLTVGGITAAGILKTINSVSSPIFYDYNDTSFYLDPNTNGNVNRINSSYFGFTVGDAAATYTYNDASTRGKFYVNSQYPVIAINVSGNSNAQHGGTLQFVASGYDSNAQWVIGSGGTCQFLDFGFGQPSNSNPHIGISGYQGKTMMRMIKSGKVGIGGNWGYYGSGDPSYDLDVLGTIRASSDIIAFSDKRVKENIITIDNALDKVTKLRGVTYTRKDIDDKSTKIGVIAQEVLKILPEVVNKDDKGMYSVAYGNMVGVLIEAIKEQQKQINELTTQIKTLQNN